MNKRIFIRTFFLSLVILAVCLAGFSKEKAVESIWTGSALAIDGSDDDWVSNTLNFEKKFEVDYAFMNDSDNLYVLFVFKNPEFLSTIRDTGMTLWINTEGKKKKRYGINFKMNRVNADTLISILEKQRGQLPEDEKNKIRSRPFYFLYQGDVIDKKGKILTPAALGGELEAPTFRLKDRQKIKVYEFKMPLRILEKLSAGQKMEPTKVVKVGFEWGGLTEKMKAERMKRLVDSRVRESDTRAKDVREGEAGRSMRDSSTGKPGSKRSIKRYSFWVDVKLAQKGQS